MTAADSDVQGGPEPQPSAPVPCPHTIGATALGGGAAAVVRSSGGGVESGAARAAESVQMQ